MTISPQQRHDILIGAGAVLVGHLIALIIGHVLDGPDPVIFYSMLILLLLGAVQLIYVIPLLAYGLWRRRAVAVGTGAVAVLTVVFSLIGLSH